MELRVQVIENDVCQQWRDDPSLWGAHGSWLEDAVFHHARAKEFFDKVEDVAIGNLGGHRLHNDPKQQVVKEALNVGIHHRLVAGFMVFKHLGQGHVTIASGTEAVGRLVKQRLEDGSQQAPKHLLSNPIANRRNTQRAQLAAAFVQEMPSQGFGFKGTVLEVGHH